MALIKTGDFESAYNTSLNQLVSTEFKPLLAEAILTYESNNIEEQSITEYIESRKDPAFFEYLANLLDDDKLMVNAGLLWAKNSEIDKAYSLLNTFPDKEYSELIALLAYDSGRKSESLIRLLELPINDSIKYDNVLLIADIFYMKENWSRSRYYYEKALDLNKLSAAPYINISSIYLEMDNIKQAITILENGIDIFKTEINSLSIQIENSNSDDGNKEEQNLSARLKDKNRDDLNQLRDEYKELVLLGYFLYKEIGSDKAIKILEDYRREFPDDVKIELLEMRENNESSNPNKFIARLWTLLNRDIDNREVSEFLIWYLLGIENYEDIELVLERSEHRHSSENWTEYYRGILSGLNGEYKAALISFDYQNLELDSWEILYNKGIIEMALLNYPEALTLFNKSIISINQLGYLNNKDIYLSKIKTKIAKVLISLNDTDEAIRILNSAFELDPENYSADLLKSIHLNLKESE